MNILMIFRVKMINKFIAMFINAENTFQFVLLISQYSGLIINIDNIQ